MNIALDFDGTFDLDPIFWETFIQEAQSRGHTVYLVTNNNDSEYIYSAMEDLLPYYQIFFSENIAKKDFMESQGIKIDIWIDNEPEYILEDKPIL